MAQDGFQKPENYIGNHDSASHPDESSQTQSQSITIDDPATGKPNWLAIQKDAYNTSTDYFDANIRRQVEKNLSLFRSKHPAGSKYYQDAYKYRSKVFRPKVRSSIRRHEAAAALAFFATQDAVTCTPEDPKDQASTFGAKFGKNWLEYRLEHSIPWFKTIIGAYQDAMNQGVVVSRNEWVMNVRETSEEVPDYDAGGVVLLNEDGSIKMINQKKKTILKDKPDISILPLENFRFSIAADWRDPVNTSPFLIEMMPMFVTHVQDRMRDDNPKTGEKKWISLTDGELLAGNNSQNEYDSTRQVREGNREDSKDEKYNLQAFDIVWVHRNIIEIKGQDWLYYTLGTTKMLSEPVPVTDVFLHGRPYTMGSAIIETHRNYPSGTPELQQDLQLEANDLSNQTLDNIKLINNKRYRGKRGTNVDWRALTASIPGGIILMDDLNDVAEEKFTDLTGSAFQVQDRNNADFDEIAGNFSTGSVDSKRSLNDTVGGMAMQLDDSNILVEYQLRCFTESWVEDTLRMVLNMGKHYETDERILKIVGEGAAPEAVATLMDTAYGLKVSVGFGATSPHKRIEKLSMGLKTIGEYLPAMMQKVKGEEVLREVFGALGFRDGSRFFETSDDENPELTAAQDQIAQLTQQLETKQADAQARVQGQIEVAKIREEGQSVRQQVQLQANHKLAQMDLQIKYIGEQIKAETNDIKRGELILQQKAMDFQKMQMLQGMKEKQLDILNQEDDRLSTVLMNDRYGLVPSAEDQDDGKKKDTSVTDERTDV